MMRRIKSIFSHRFLCRFLIVIMVVSFLMPSANALQKKQTALNKNKITIYEGGQSVLKLTGSSKKAAWSSSSKAVATVNNKGVVVGRKAGTATITAKVGKKSYKCVVTVKRVTINKTKLNLKVGKRTRLKLNGAKIQSASSSNPSVAAVAKNGTVTARKSGTVVITLTGSNKKKYKCKVNAIGYLTPASLSLQVGGSATIKLHGAKIASIKSSNTSVATVQKTGKVTAKGSGSAKITVTGNDKKKYTCTVSVKKKMLTVTFNSNGGSNISSVKVEAGTCLKLPVEPTRANYTFAGWYLDQALTKKFDASIPVTASLTLFAKWSPNNGNTASLTREQWIVKLARELKVQGSTEHYHLFDDFEQAEHPELIDAAIQQGFVVVSPDEDNIVKFNPKGKATREFVAFSTVMGLRMKEADTLPDCSDASSLLYPEQDMLAVKMGMIALVNNKFLPSQAITNAEAEKTLSIVKAQIKSTQIRTDAESTVTLASGVEETNNIDFETNDENNTITIYRSNSEAQQWQAGEIHVLRDPDHPEKDIAIKVDSVQKKNNKIVVNYTTPELSEVITSFDVEGITSQNGTFTPAEGVTVLESNGVETQGATSGTVGLFGKQKLALNVGKFSGEVTVDLENIEYRFSADPSWHLVTINEVYLCLNSSVEFTLAYTKSAGNGVKAKLGDFNVPLGNGFYASGEIYFIASAEGKGSLNWVYDHKEGIQYTKAGGIRPIYETTRSSCQPKLEGAIKAGLELEPGAEFLGIDLVSVGADVGFAFEGTLSNVSIARQEFCLDGTGFVFLTLYAQIGWDDLNLRREFEIMNSDYSIFKKQYHFEEVGRVDECTRGKGKYKGSVVNAKDGQPIAQAKVQIFRDGELKDLTYTDGSGNYIGIELPAGEYLACFSAPNYKAHQQFFNIIGGETTSLNTQRMIPKDMDETYPCRGVVNDAFNGNSVEGAHVIVSRTGLQDTQIVADCYTDSYGEFYLELPTGNYLFAVSKDGYVTSTEYVTMVDENNNVNISINPRNAGGLRAVLTWGSYPEDLDSHMLWDTGDGSGYHVYYSNMQEPTMMLDVDDTSSYGPETITVSNMSSGVYHYYIHNYSDKDESYSTSLSESGAKVVVYLGNRQPYTIYVPSSVSGTLWHVFDYNPETEQITLINQFSYCSSPSSVGANLVYASLDVDDTKESKDQKAEESPEAGDMESETDTSVEPDTSIADTDSENGENDASQDTSAEEAETSENDAENSSESRPDAPSQDDGSDPADPSPDDSEGTQPSEAEPEAVEVTDGSVSG